MPNLRMAVDFEQLQALCERGQQELIAMQYLQAEATLALAEAAAWEARQWETLSRLYMPLQEARRQRRQRAGEGVVCLGLLAKGPREPIDVRQVAGRYPQGQLLVAGWGEIGTGIALRRLAAEGGLYLDTFLAAVYPTSSGNLIAIVPHAQEALPEPEPCDPAALRERLPAHSLLLREGELPGDPRPGSYQTYGEVMAIWEQLHRPFVAAADAIADPVARMSAYRRAIEVDYACELAHQKLSDVARAMSRPTTRQG